MENDSRSAKTMSVKNEACLKLKSEGSSQVSTTASLSSSKILSEIT